MTLRMLGLWLCNQAPHEKIRLMARLEDVLLVAIILLAIVGMVWFWAAYTRRKQTAEHEKHLQSYILQDPKWREIYFRSRKENKQGAEK